MFPILEKQRRRFRSQATLDLGFRKRALHSLQDALKEWTPQLCAALQTDLGKSEEEAMLTEIGMLTRSIRHALRHMRSWSRTRWVHTPATFFPAFSRVRVEPYGCALIISPWNYPVLLALDPPDIIFFLNLFALGGLECTFFWPLIGGLFWKKGTREAAVASSVGAAASYIFCYYNVKVAGINAVVWGLLIGGIIYFLVGHITSKKGLDPEILDKCF